ncbi:MAG: GAF domain-containing protein [Thiobacillus sp.]|nr:GAF domain-containing protein [Thiobacillus sp.]
MGRSTGYAGLHDYNRAIRDIAASADWQSGKLARQLERLVQVAARYMGVGRVGIWRMQQEQNRLDCVCQFDSRFGLTQSVKSLGGNQFPAYFAELTKNRVMAVVDALNDPMTAELVDGYIKPLKIASLLDAPIWLDGEMVGVVCHEHSGIPRVWRDEDVAFAGSMSDFAAMALSQNRYQQVESARERLTRIIEATPDVVAIMATNGYLIQMNPAGRQLLGLTERDDVTRFRSRDFLGEQTTYLLETEILPALHRSGRWTGEALLREDSPQALPVSVVALAHHDMVGQLEYYSVTLRDLTAQKAIQREIEALNNELEARVRIRTQELEFANRNLESFAYSVSHDLKAPLRGIEGYSRLLANEYRDSLPEEAREFIDLIGASSRRMDRMIEDILAYSRAQIRQLKVLRTDVDQLIQQVVSEFDQQFRDGVVLTLQIEPAVLECDREGMVQILRNFLANALKYSRESTPPRIRVEGSAEAGGYRISVNDNGMGFDMRYHDRIFEIFHRLTGTVDQDGTGIGLALAARSAERMGGRVWAESAPGQGATFFFELDSGTHA